jgi:hypothetical protein
MTKSRKMRWAEYVARMEEKCIQKFDRKSWRMQTTRKPRHWFEDNIKIDLKEIR